MLGRLEAQLPNNNKPLMLCSLELGVYVLVVAAGGGGGNIRPDK